MVPSSPLPPSVPSTVPPSVPLGCHLSVIVALLVVVGPVSEVLLLLRRPSSDLDGASLVPLLRHPVSIVRPRVEPLGSPIIPEPSPLAPASGSLLMVSRVPIVLSLRGQMVGSCRLLSANILLSEGGLVEAEFDNETNPSLLVRGPVSSLCLMALAGEGGYLVEPPHPLLQDLHDLDHLPH